MLLPHSFLVSIGDFKRAPIMHCLRVLNAVFAGGYSEIIVAATWEIMGYTVTLGALRIVS